jgi:hypothetical protein
MIRLLSARAAGGEAGRGGSEVGIQGELYRRPNALRILHDFDRTKPKDAPTVLLHVHCPARVAIDLIGVMITIDFDDQFSRDAGEIGEVTTNRMLAPKLNLA